MRTVIHSCASDDPRATSGSPAGVPGIHTLRFSCRAVINKRAASALVMLAAVLAGSAQCCLAASWNGVEVLPRSADLRIRRVPAESYSYATLHDIEWPAVVQATDGQWLMIGDHGGYTDTSLRGWVKKDEVVVLEEAHDFCTEEISAARSALVHGLPTKEFGDAEPEEAVEFFHWVRGIFWESQNDGDAAIADYADATTPHYSGWNGDALLRQGRMLASRATLHGADAKVYGEAEAKFREAKRFFDTYRRGRVPAQLYVDWGDAYFAWFKSSEDLSQADRADELYRAAERANLSWPRAAHQQGRLLLERADRDADPRTTLLAALERFSQSIRLSPNYGDAYEGRAAALVRLARLSQDQEAVSLLERARQSADRAYDLGHNRVAQSIATKAVVSAAIAQITYPDASKPPVDLVERAKLNQALVLYLDAQALAEDAANRSANPALVAERLRQAMDYGGQASALSYLLAQYDAQANAIADLAAVTRVRLRERLVQSITAAAEGNAAVSKALQEFVEADTVVEAAERANTHDQRASAEPSVRLNQPVTESKRDFAIEGETGPGDKDLSRALELLRQRRVPAPTTFRRYSGAGYRQLYLSEE